MITGASSGIGAATARTLAADGYRVALLARRADRIQALADELGDGAVAIEADVTDRDQLIAVADRVKNELGGADVLVNNAGVMLLGPSTSDQRTEQRRMVEVNLLGAMTPTEFFLDQLREGGGDLVNISSVAGRDAGPGGAVHHATKWGVNGRATSRSARSSSARLHRRCSSMPQNQSSPIPTLTLNDGVQLPPLGYGVFQTPPEATVAAVQPALRVGYRHIDTAAGYGNEREVGEGIRRSGIDRSDVFLETKVWISDYGYDATLHAFDKSAAKLGVEQIDLLILHQPMPTAFDRTVAAYKALESLLADGRVRAIGVSNFMPDHVDRLLADVSVVPAVNRVEVHPYFRQTAVLEKDAENGVVSQAWSPIGGITFYPGWGASDRRSTVDDPVLRSIGERYGKTAAQVGLRWHLEQGRSAIPKSVNARGGRVLGLLPLVGALALTAVACATGSAAERRENLTRVRITIGKTVLTAHLQDNPTARPLIAQLPLTLSFRDFHGQEKVAGLPRPLSMRGMPKSADPRPGEIGYYAPTRELVLYTTDVGRFDGIARIGRFDGSVAAIRNRKSDFVARIELARWRQ